MAMSESLTVPMPAPPLPAELAPTSVATSADSGIDSSLVDATTEDIDTLSTSRAEDMQMADVSTATHLELIPDLSISSTPARSVSQVDEDDNLDGIRQSQFNRRSVHLSCAPSPDDVDNDDFDLIYPENTGGAVSL